MLIFNEAEDKRMDEQMLIKTALTNTQTFGTIY